MNDPCGVTSENEVLMILKTIIIFALHFQRFVTILSSILHIFTKIFYFRDLVTFYQDFVIRIIKTALSRLQILQGVIMLYLFFGS